jgi:hypothetical protein
MYRQLNYCCFTYSINILKVILVGMTSQCTAQDVIHLAI